MMDDKNDEEVFCNPYSVILYSRSGSELEAYMVRRVRRVGIDITNCTYDIGGGGWSGNPNSSTAFPDTMYVY